MFAFEMKRDNKYVGLLMDPSKGKLLSLNESQKLLPYVEQAFKTKDKALQNVKVTATEKGYTLSGLHESTATREEQLDEIEDVCRKLISESVIVPQSMGAGPTIRHRPLYFAVNDATNQLVVKYYQIPKENSFDLALEQIKQRFERITPAKRASLKP